MPQTLDEPPIGFSLMYYSGKHGLRGFALPIALHDKRSQETIKEILYQAYVTTCRGIQPRTVKKAVSAILDDSAGPQGPKAA